MNNKKYSHIAIHAIIVIALSALLVMLLIAARDFFIEEQYSGILAILDPFIFGFVFAYLLNPLMSLFETRVFHKVNVRRKDANKEWKFRRVLSVTATFLTAAVFVTLLMLLIIPQVRESVDQLVVNVADLFSPADNLPAESQASANAAAPGNYLDEFGAFISDEYAANDMERVYNYLMTLKIGTIISDAALTVQDFISGFGIRVDIESSVRELFLAAAANISVLVVDYSQTIVDATANFIMGTAKQVMNILIALIIAIYILSDKEHLISQIKRLLFAVFPEGAADKAVDITRKTHKIFGSFILGKLLDSLIIGIICFIGMAVLRLDYAVLISVLIGITNIIPFFGPFIGAIPSIILLLINDPSQAVIFTIFILVLQQVDGNIIGPKIIGDNIGLSAFWVIFSILVMNGLLGPVGMFIGVPLFTVIYTVVKDFSNNRLAKKGIFIRKTDPAYMIRTDPARMKGRPPDEEPDGFAAPEEFAGDRHDGELDEAKKIPAILDKLAKNIHKYINKDT